MRALGGKFDAYKRLGIIIPETASHLEKWNAAAKQAAEIVGGQLEGDSKGVSDAFEAMGRLIAVSRVFKAVCVIL